MRRRDLLWLLGLAVAASRSNRLRAQQNVTPVIGLLSGASPSDRSPVLEGLRQGLIDGGYLEGRDVNIEYRWAEGHFDRLPTLANDLVGRRVALIATVTLPAAFAAKAASPTTPVVFVIGEDPVKAGLVGSLNHPDANATGISDFINQLSRKRLEIIREAVHGVAAIGFLVNPKNPNAEADAKEVEAAADALGQKLVRVEASNESELDQAFAGLADERVGAVCVNIDPFLITAMDQIIALAAKHRLPAMYPTREFVAAGGLMSYSPNRLASWHQAGRYAARILRGDKVADLPVQQASSIELLINLKTARVLGLTMPTPLLARADEVIE